MPIFTTNLRPNKENALYSTFKVNCLGGVFLFRFAISTEKNFLRLGKKIFPTAKVRYRIHSVQIKGISPILFIILQTAYGKAVFFIIYV